MNTLHSVLDEVFFRIPDEVLNHTFLRNTRSWRQAPLNLHEEVIGKVIKPRVMRRMAERGGQTIRVDLGSIAPIFKDKNCTVYRMPPALLSNRELVCVLRCSYLPMGTSYVGFGTDIGTIYQNGSSGLTSIGSRIADSTSMAPVISTSQIDVVGHNTVSIRDQIKNIGMYTLFCQVTDDPFLNNIHPRSHMILAKLFEYSLKAFIYKHLVIKMDAGVLDMGQELGAFRNIVEGYADSEEMFQETLRTKWGKIAFMNDEHRINRHYRSMINPAL